MENEIKTKVIGINVTSSVTLIALVDIRGNILAKDTLKTTDYPNVNGFVEALAEHIMLLSEANGGYQTIRSVGISAPSANFVTGCIENAPNMPWKGIIPLAAMLRDSIGLAVALGNDAHVSALGESVYGYAHGMNTFIIVTLGRKGVGSGFFSYGQPHLGTDGFAGEIGHCCIDVNGRPCNCGRKGCLERYVSIQGILQTAREMLEQTDHPSLLRSAGELTIEQLKTCADQGDELAREVWNVAGTTLGISLANYATVVNPEAVILTGVLLEHAKWMMAPMEKSFYDSLFHNIRSTIRLLVSPINNSDRDVLGASVLAWKVKEYSLFK
jgi:glucokinase